MLWLRWVRSTTTDPEASPIIKKPTNVGFFIITETAENYFPARLKCSALNGAVAKRW